jgi:hypothetical protein
MKKLLIAVLMGLVSSTAFAFTENVTVSWNDPGSEDSFALERFDAACAATNAMGWAVVATPAADVLSYQDTVADGKTYCYRIKAVKNGINGPYSPLHEVVVPASIAPLSISSVVG